MKKQSRWLCVCGVLVALGLSGVEGKRPNVILMMTDDQGIGDFGVMGNPLIETPNIDALAKNAGSMTTFYVSPVCSPTRASLMTGRYNYRTRCIDTWVGRSMMDPDEFTLAEALKVSGYATGIFGKWHLGDCYPMRPMDQGFDDSLIHLGGGLAQPSEPLENGRRYTDPILFRNGKAVQTKGFCTDVYFDGAMAFADQQVAANKPFFIYLATNAPHGPYHDVPPALLAHYQKKPLEELMISQPTNPKQLEKQKDQLARIAAMITNEDQNVGRLMAYLKDKGVLENTLVIRMNDNGPNSMRYVGPVRGMKTNIHEGGVRSPCWLHWPAKIKPGTVRDELTAHIDIMPTILEACGAVPGKHALDGKSFLPLLLDPEAKAPSRNLVIQTHRGDVPVRYHHFFIREGDWKLMNPSGFGAEALKGEPAFELYNLGKDPAESKNVIAQHPEVFQRLKKVYDAWFDDVSSTRPDNYAPPRIVVGTPYENPTVLSRQDWRGGTWHPRSEGHWLIEIAKPMVADVRVRFLPEALSEVDTEITLKLGGRVVKQALGAHALEYTFKQVTLAKGPAKLEVHAGSEKEPVGVYHVEIHRK